MLISSGLFAQNVKFSAEIQNRNSDSIVISNKTFHKTMRSKNGNFSAEFEVAKGIYQYFDGAEFAFVYLEPNFDFKLIADAKQFHESLDFTGIGSHENKFLAKKWRSDEATKAGFREKIPTKDELSRALEKRLSDVKIALSDGNYDKDFVSLMLSEYEIENVRIISQFNSALEKMSEKEKMNGKTAPDFEFENQKGVKIKLSSFRGKYVYIDVWATWCAPCRTEIPHLKKLEEKFKNHKIAFVSISVDAEKDRAKWRKFTSEKQLGGTQLFAHQSFNSAWIKTLKIDAIPRFILISPDGKIVDVEADRPSSEDLIPRLKALLEQ